MPNTNNVRNDNIPYRSGIVRLTPLDENSNPIYAQSITTKRQFLTSTQITTTRTSESLPNGNGSDKDFPTDERHTLALVTQTYDPKFHSMLSGSEKVSNPGPVIHDTTVVPNDSGEVDLTGDFEPVAAPNDPDNKIWFEIRDSYGNALEETASEVNDATQFKYDSDTKKLTFDTSLANVALSCIYYVSGEGGDAYQASPILKNKQFQVEVFAEMQSAEYGDITNYYARMPRATVSGDIPRVTSQKSISAAITYNFQSAPVPQGMSAFYESYTPATTA